MKPAIFLYTLCTVVLSTISGTCHAQFRFSSTAAIAAMNTNTYTNAFSGTTTNTSPSYSLYSNTYTSTSANLHDIYVMQPAYTTTVTVSYGIPGIILFDWAAMHSQALNLLSYGPGSGNDINYLASDIGALNALAYNSYVNPPAYGARTLQLNVLEWNGNLNWYSDYAGGGQFVKNWILWILPPQGKLYMQIK